MLSSVYSSVSLLFMMGTEVEGGREAAQGVLTLYSLHHFVNNILKSGDLQMYLFWNKNNFF